MMHADRPTLAGESGTSTRLVESNTLPVNTPAGQWQIVNERHESIGWSKDKGVVSQDSYIAIR